MDIKTPVVIEMSNSETFFFKICKTKWHMMDQDIKLSEVQRIDPDPRVNEDESGTCGDMELSDAFLM